MKAITRQKLADEVPRKWEKTYENYKSTTPQGDAKKKEITRQLLALKPPIDPDQVDDIIGNDSWTRMPPCDECEEDKDLIICCTDRQHREDDPEGNVIYLCQQCLANAVLLTGIG